MACLCAQQALRPALHGGMRRPWLPPSCTKNAHSSKRRLNGRSGTRCRAPGGPDEGSSTSATPAGADPQPRDETLRDYEHPMDVNQFRGLGHRVVDWVANYYGAGLKAGRVNRVRPVVQPAYLRPLLPSSAPEKPDPWDQVFADFSAKLLPGATHWQDPRFFAWLPANSSFPSLLADMLAGALSMIGFSWAASPVSTELEMVMMDWLVDLTGLPPHWKHSAGGPGGGSIQGSAGEALLVVLLAARARALKGRQPEDANRLVAYASDQAHEGFKKACMIAGITHMRVLQTHPQHDFALQPSALLAAMQTDLEAGLLPFFVTATIGTDASCAVDPVAALAEVAHSHGYCSDIAADGSSHGLGESAPHSASSSSSTTTTTTTTSPSTNPPPTKRAWVHVDAAYAGSAAVCPELRAQYFGGLEAVDSYAFSPHTWMLTNYDCCALWASDSGPLKDALSLTPFYLRGAGNVLDLKDWQVPLGRRFRSLKLFFVLRLYGAEALRRYIRHHCALAAWFAYQVASDPRLELAAPPRFGLVCFRLAGMPNSVNEAFLSRLHEGGDLALSDTDLAGQFTIRLAVGSPHTQLVHVKEAWEAVQAAVAHVLATHAAGSTGSVDQQASG